VKYAFYPGCSLDSTAKEYRESTEIVARDLGIELEEIPGWICCGSTPAHMASKLLSVTLPAYNLVRARAVKAEGVIVPCASCYSRLRTANYRIKQSEELRDKVRRALGEPYDGDVPVYHVLEVFARAIEEGALEGRLKNGLEGLKVAGYYGCLLVRPPEIAGFDDPEDPRLLDRVTEALGGEPVEWRHKVECCGAALAFTQPDVVLKLSGAVLEDAQYSGAQVVSVACPLCHSNLDLRQRNIEKYTGNDLEIPVMYVTQLMGLALGHSAGELGLRKHSINPIPVLKKAGVKV
jgi:heterodisulfide reductase subunit B